MTEPALPATADLVIRNGSLIDGSGASPQRLDIAVTGERIVAIGDLAQVKGGREVDARGKVVAPGFIDAHTHDDNLLLRNPAMTPKVSQGVTTVVVGNCGVSLAPVTLDGPPPPPLDLLGDRETYRFPRFADYLDTLDREPAAVNAVAMVGHSALRVANMDRVDRAATAEETRTMARLVAESVAAGAIGMSTGLFYAPANAAPTEEVIELAKAARSEGGIYVTHMRNEDAGVMDSLAETFRIGRESDMPVIVSHHKVAGRPNFGRTTDTLPFIAAERRKQPIGLDVYPYVAASTVLTKNRLAASEKVIVTWSKARPGVSGRDLAEIAREMGVGLEEAVDALQPAGAIYFMMSEEDVQRILKFPDAMIGSDGLPHDTFPHPRLWGTFPRVLGHYSREVGLFPLHEAVYRMTGLTARQFGLKERGVLKVGNYADITVFDPATVIDRATFADPMQPADGIDLVIVNGRVVWQDRQSTGARPGKALRRQQLDPAMGGWQASGDGTARF